MCDILDMLIMTGANGRLGRVLAKTLAERGMTGADSRVGPDQPIQQESAARGVTKTHSAATELTRTPRGDQKGWDRLRRYHWSHGAGPSTRPQLAYPGQ
jgi:NAD(P)-dependent dehydrogenase (short-subunit alcohol dehydrogenase family)